MRFGKQLELGTYESWKQYYLQYDKLKRVIKKKKFLIDRQNESESLFGGIRREFSKSSSLLQLSQNIPDESTPLNRDSGDYNKKASLNENIDFFAVIQSEIEKINKFFVGKLAELRISLDQITSKRRNVYFSHHTSAETDLVRLRDIYIQLAALRSYCDLNQTGFYKIIKKHDKVLEEKTLETWMPIIDKQPFAMSPEPLQLMDIITSLVSRDKLIEWEMFATEFQNKNADDMFPSVRVHGLLIAIVVYLVSLAVPLVTPNDPAACRCMSLLLFIVCLWITEALPYFATAILIPILITFMGVLKDTTSVSKINIMNAEAAAAFITSHIFNHTTWLLLGGYTVSTAFSRCQLELRLASLLQQGLGNRPKVFILAIMMLGLFLSMWISNHTAPILCGSIILPIVKDLPSDSRFSKAILIGLAFACNFGGMMTPISSLQNALAASYLEQVGIPISFGRWIAVALPFGVFCTVISWLLILLIIRPNDIDTIPLVVYEKSNVFGKRNVAVILSSLLTIALFATSSWTKDTFGDISIISLCFVAFMFGSGILTEVDFNSLSWHTLVLVGGGNVLGKAVESSGLLGYIADGITKSLPLGYPWLSLLCILFFCGGIATFVSHTVAAIILLPLIARIGVSLAIPEVVVVGSAFAISAAMALPFSSFPNVSSLLMTDDLQRPYLSVRDFLITGIPMSILSIFLIATLGFALISLILVN